MSPFSDADLMHAKGPEPSWQESVVLFFHDEASGLSAYFRLGIEPNVPACQEWIYIQSASGRRFRRLRFGLPVTERSRRPDGFSAGGLNWTYEQDCIRLTGEYEDVQFDLRFYGFYPSTPCWKWIGSGNVDIGAPNHFENSGRVEGRLSIAGEAYPDINAFGHRDHSWGPRDGSRMRACRWAVGTVGPELSHTAISFVDSKGRLALGGWAVRNGMLTHAKQIDIVNHENIDGLTSRGGILNMVLEDDSVIVVEIEVLASFITGHNTDRGGVHSYVCSEGISRTRIGNKRGVCCFTICNNATGGEMPVEWVAERFSTLVDGHSQVARSS
jgi:hypothetical protein